MLEPMKFSTSFVYSDSPGFPSGKQIKERLSRFRAKVDLVCLVCNYSTAIRPEVESIEVFVLGEIVGIRKTVKFVSIDGPCDLRAVHLTSISAASSRLFLELTTAKLRRSSLPGRCVNPELNPIATQASDVTDKETPRMMREDLFMVTTVLRGGIFGMMGIG